MDITNYKHSNFKNEIVFEPTSLKNISLGADKTIIFIDILLLFIEFNHF